MRALVYGLARSGRAAIERLDDPVVVDSSLGNEDDLSLLDDVDVIVKSPGVPREAPLVLAAHDRGIPVWSEVELGFRLLPGSKFVGVTGTNGKTTTAELLGAIFRAAGRDVAVAGNVGTPLTSVREADWVVCELSSFQLEDVHELRLRRRCSAQSRARPPRPARLLRGLPGREAAHLRAGAARRSSRAASASTGSSSRRTMLCRRSR